MKKVTKDEFDRFIDNYGKPLERHVTAICDPPILSYNDFSKNKKWPKSVVAKIVLNTAMEGHPDYDGEPDDYYINIGCE